MSKRTYGHASLLLGPRLMRPIADDDFVICRNARMDIRYGHVSPSRRLMRPAVDNYFVICRYARTGMCLYCQADV